MKLISYYWYPWNNPGVFRWLRFSRHINIDTVITADRPVGSFVDQTLPAPGIFDPPIRRFGVCAALWGLLIIPAAIRHTRRGERVIITCPPESLLVTALILQFLRRRVYVDMRDAIDRRRQPCKFLIPVYRFFYRRIARVCVCMQFIDPSKKCIYHGYDDLGREPAADCGAVIRGGFGPFGRMQYVDFLDCLREGFKIDYQYARGYGSRSVITALRYGLALNADKLHDEYKSLVPRSWAHQAEEMSEWMNRTE